MASVRLKLEGDVKTIPVRVFLTAVESELKVLIDLDTAISGEPKGTLDWFVTDLRIGSLVVDVESRPRSDYKDNGPEVSRAIVASLEAIEHKGTTPPYLSPEGMRNVKRMLNTVGKDKALGLTLSSPSERVGITISAKANTNIKQLIPIRHQSLGSIEGRMEMVNIHGGSRFVVYDARTKRAITCNFDRTRLLDAVKELLGYRVNISGIIYSNILGEPLKVDVEDIRRLRSKEELPSIEEITGIDPNFTNGLSTADYLRRMSVG